MINVQKHFSIVDIITYIFALDLKFSVNLFKKFGDVGTTLKAAKLLMFIRLNPIHGIRNEKENLDLENKLTAFFEEYCLVNKRFKKFEEKKNQKKTLLEILNMIKGLSDSG